MARADVLARGSEAVRSREAVGTSEAANNLTASTAHDATRFAEYDLDGSMSLDFEEFLAMQPARIRETYSADEIRSWFNAADTDGNGVLSINEFFCWSLNNASTKHGKKALEAAFRKYDRDKSGYLDSFEFKRAATDMGFGTVAHDLFKNFDVDQSGTGDSSFSPAAPCYA